MNEENSLKLKNDFKNLYGDNLFLGFECGDGWFNLLYRLSEKLGPLGVVAFQVKEKFGGLRFYLDDVSGGKENINKAYSFITEAEEESYETCELCGNKGKVRNSGGWLKTLCDECNTKKEEG